MDKVKKSKVVEAYLREIRSELFGIDNSSALSILEEIETHLTEKAMDVVRRNKMNEPTEEIYERVIADFGEPWEVVREYLKELPETLDNRIKIFLYLQGILAVIIIIIGFDMLTYINLYSDDFINLTQLNMMFVAAGMIIAIGMMTAAMIALQLKKPKTIIHYGSTSTILALALAIGFVLVFLQYLLSRYTRLDYSLDIYYAYSVPALMILIFIFISGLKLIERFQRRMSLGEKTCDLRAYGPVKRRITILGVIFISILLISMAMLGLVRNDEYWWDKDSGGEHLFNAEHIGGKYDAELQLSYGYRNGYWQDEYRIIYTMNGEKYEGGFAHNMRPSLDWIRNNTPEDAVIVSWWDYGHSIRGYAGRDVVVDEPSRSIEDTIYDPSTVRHWEENEELLEDVAKIFISVDLSESLTLMQKYNATYFITNSRDRCSILYAFFVALDMDMGDYFDFSDENFLWNPTEKGKQMLMYRLWNDEEISGLEMVYSDIDTRIFRIE